MIALLCPTRDRPTQYQRMAESAKATALTPIKIISATNGDCDYADLYFPNDCPTSYVWNTLAQHEKQTSTKLFMLASDDIIFSTTGWDKAILDHYNELENKIHVYALQDSRDIDGTPHPIVTREYLDAMGYFIPPIFLHWYVDTWTVEIAKANSCFTHLKNYLLIHDKPSDQGRADETHNRIRRNGWKEHDKFVNETCQHFLDLEKIRLAKILAQRALDLNVGKK